MHQISFGVYVNEMPCLALPFRDHAHGKSSPYVRHSAATLDV